MLDAPRPRSLKVPAFLLGLSLGGFFDGILLHQVLQWHHLLSNVASAALQDLRAQVLADGLFHALMYVIAVVALVQLWRHRAALPQAGGDRLLWSWSLMGFGGWHMLDAVVSHWITGIHRIKVDSPNPLAWDLFWFAVFGVLPLVAGWWMQRRPPGRSGGGGRAAAALGLAAAIAGPVAALPSGDATQVLVMFRPGIAPASAFNALAELDARVLWVDRSGGLWAIQMQDRREAQRLYSRGALLVSSSLAGFGCIAWSKARPG